MAAVPSRRLAAAPVAYRDYSRCSADFLTKLADTARAKRDTALSGLTSQKAIHARQSWVKQTFTDLIGGLPERTDLKTKITGSFEREGYRVDRLYFESRPKFFVTANFYLPLKRKPPFPGVLFQMGHSANGKAYDSYQRACQGLARLGFAVFAFDPMGQGERIYYPDASGVKTRLGSADDEHSVPGRQMLLAGTTCAQMQLWDAMRALDVLASHKDIDPERLASAGQSGGATVTMMLCAMDERLAAAAVMSGNTENFACPDFLAPGSVDDAEQDFVGSAAVGFDRCDLLYAFAPKPLLFSISDKDFLGTYSPNYVANSRLEFGRLHAVYARLGAGDHLKWNDTPLPHGLSYASRLALYNWLATHLLHESGEIEKEPDVTPEKDRTLWVTKSGSTIKDLHSNTPFQLTEERVAALTASVGHRRELRDLLGLETPRDPVLKELEQIPFSRTVSVAAVEVNTASDVFAPAWLFQKTGESSKKPVVLLLDASGRNHTWHEDELSDRLANQGFVVAAADIRGVGDLTPAFPGGNPAYAREHEEEEAFAWAGLILGRPLLGQRTTDILALAAALRKRFAGRPLVIAASGRLTIPALAAAALDSAVAGLYLSGSLATFRSLVEEEEVTQPFCNSVPELLLTDDIPELVRRLAPRRVLFAGPVDANNRALRPAAAVQLFGAAISAGHFQTNPERGWTSESITSFLNSF